LQWCIRGQNDILIPEQFLGNTGIPFINSIVNEIQDAFNSTPLLKSFGALDPRNLPDDAQEPTEYADVSLKMFKSD